MTGEGESSAPGGGESPLEDVLKKLGDHLVGGGFFQSAGAGSDADGAAEDEGDVPTETVIGGFKLIKPLGRGGMGQVWEAEELAIGRRVALKLLHPHVEFSTKGLDRFEREAQAGGKLSHPGIVQVLSVGSADSRHYMAQELVEGSFTLADSLSGFRESDELPKGYYRRMAALFVRIGEALSHAHERGVIHRDIKPSNILIGADDHPKVVDFGLALMEDSLSLSRTGEFMGTPFYMSPEQAATKRMGIDHRTDVFSLGATLYEALTLTRPFKGDTSQQVFRQILLVDPPAPRQLRSRVPEELAVICLKALEKDPDRRYTTMSAFVDDLGRFLSDRPILARPPTTAQRAVKWTKRNPTKSMVGAVIAIALTVVSVKNVELEASRQQLIETKEDLEEAVRAKDIAIRAKDIQVYENSLLAAYFSLTASKFMEVAGRLSDSPEMFRGWEWSYLKLRSDSSIFSFAKHKDRVRCVAISSDRKTVASGSRDGELLLWERESGRKLQSLHSPEGAIYCVAFSPDGQHVAVGTDRGRLIVWRVDSGKEVVSKKAHPKAIHCVGFSPDGKRLASGSAVGTIKKTLEEIKEEDILLLWDTELWDTEAWVPNQSLKGHSDWVRSLAFRGDGMRLITGSNDGTVRLWDVSTGKSEEPIVIGRGVKGQVMSVDINSNGSRWIAVTAGGHLVGWDRLGGLKEDFEKLSATCRSLRFKAEEGGLVSGAKFITGSEDGVLRLWDWEAGEVIQEFVGHTKPIFGVAVGAGNGVESLAFSASRDMTVRVWDLRMLNNPAKLRTAEKHLAEHYFNAKRDDPRLEWVLYSPEATVRIGGKERVIQFRDGSGDRHTDHVTDVVLSPDGGMALSSSIDGTVRAWDTETGALRFTLDNGTALNCVIMSPDSKRIITGVSDETLALWDLSTLTKIISFDHPEGPPFDVAFSPDGHRLFTAYIDKEDGDFTVRGQRCGVFVWDSRLEDALTLWRDR